MEKVTGLIKLLGEENEKRLKDTITDIIIDAVRDDVDSYTRQSYIIDPDEFIEFVEKCKEEAFATVREELVNSMTIAIKNAYIGNGN